MFVILAGNFPGEPGVSKVIVKIGGGPLPVGFVTTHVVGTASSFFEAFDLACDGAIAAA